MWTVDFQLLLTGLLLFVLYLWWSCILMFRCCDLTNYQVKMIQFPESLLMCYTTSPTLHVDSTISCLLTHSYFSHFILFWISWRRAKVLFLCLFYLHQILLKINRFDSLLWFTTTVKLYIIFSSFLLMLLCHVSACLSPTQQECKAGVFPALWHLHHMENVWALFRNRVTTRWSQKTNRMWSDCVSHHRSEVSSASWFWLLSIEGFRC